MIIISNKLFSEIMNITDLRYIKVIDLSTIEYAREENGPFNISTIRIQDRCKTWALEHEYEILSRKSYIPERGKHGGALLLKFDKWLDEGIWFNARTESHAVIKATEHILDNLEKS